MNTSEFLVKKFGLTPHPEGGFFKETYRSAGKIGFENPGTDLDGERNYSTCIYFLLCSDSFSAFHRIIQDEIWHFYDGSPVELHMISPTGNYSLVILGRNIHEEQVYQLVIPGGTWFAARVAPGNDYSLVGCTVSPGFEFSDFELGNRESLLQILPEHEAIIRELTRTDS